jgi:protein farnesyltransferase subunit beta
MNNNTENRNKCKAQYFQPTKTTSLQSQTEAECAPFFISIPDLPRSHINDLIRLSLIDPDTKNVLLIRQNHANYLRGPLHEKSERMLPGSYISLDSSKPWILYWTLHSLDLLDELPSEEMLQGIVYTLEACWSDVKTGDGNGDGGGGFAGGVGQMPHCATSYAAVMALSIIAGCDQGKYPVARALALHLLQRKRSDMLKWYLTLRYEIMDESTSTLICGYRMHHDGEVDVRATFCICAVVSLLNILTEELKNGMIEHIVSCQTYEGGFGGEPGTEAHGGYTFCALSALHIVAKDSGFTSLSLCGVDVEALEDWLVKRQMGYEGGFNGRSNKLVDGCYTFWVGGAIAILDLDRFPAEMSPSTDPNNKKYDSGIYGNDFDPLYVQRLNSETGETKNDCPNARTDGNLTFDQLLLQQYVLLCAQDTNGGLRDKPSKSRDFYHSCYNLSGLSVSQHVLSPSKEGSDNNNLVLYQGEGQNILGATHPVYNIRIERVQFMINSFCSSP